MPIEGETVPGGFWLRGTTIIVGATVAAIGLFVLLIVLLFLFRLCEFLLNTTFSESW